MDEITEMKRRAGITESNMGRYRQILQSTISYLSKMDVDSQGRVPIKNVITFFQDALKNLPADCD